MATQVNTEVSDLFFNTDHEAAALLDDRGNFAGFNDEVLLEEAASFIASLERLGVAPLRVPTKENLVADFHKRV